ncbi:hypothetical protein C5167_009229 [Papaver somniferum]|uniref:RRM domain-containing protein n=1 Tax=Papaver somniferum TaxID=3469 RepID=A0A4Y7JZW3_PAPSO|nr:hypothetical protein C5167_009229 [Papaver somniferum]
MAMKMAIPRFASKRMFSNFAFSPPPIAAAASAPPAAEPSTKLFVSGLNKRTTSEALTDAFAKFGELGLLLTMHVSEYSRGYGFVRYATLDDAAEGIKGMDGKVRKHYAWSSPVPSRQFLVFILLVFTASLTISHLYVLYFLDGWVIFAEYARPRTQQSPPVKNTGLPPLYKNY